MADAPSGVHADLITYLREMATLLDRGQPLSSSESLNLRVAVEDAAEALAGPSSRERAAADRHIEVAALDDALRAAEIAVRTLLAERPKVNIGAQCYAALKAALPIWRAALSRLPAAGERDAMHLPEITDFEGMIQVLQRQLAEAEARRSALLAAIEGFRAVLVATSTETDTGGPTA